MLGDLIDDLVKAIGAGNEVRKERALKDLERVGMDRFTAMQVVRQIFEEKPELSVGVEGMEVV